MLSTCELKERYPVMDTQGVLAGLYSPHDGSLDPAGWCEALVRAAKMNGAQVKVCFFLYLHAQLSSMTDVLHNSVYSLPS